jgi:anthranilate/para-aminobenzoate synthase component I
VKLRDLEALPSFALLGPGFGGGQFLLLRDLRPAAHTDPMLVFAEFEQAGASALKFAAGSVQLCNVEPPPGGEAGLHITLGADGYGRKVSRIREAIARGDVYQVCLTTRARVSPATGAGLLAVACRRGVPRFAAWVRLPDGLEFVSASPELFFETDGDRVHTEPMKGTARLEAAVRLEASEKERAELAMITDLLRHDLAQVCRPGTVRVVNERRAIVLPYALQTVSDVVGVLETGVTPLDVLATLHPGGSVTGAPKRAALAMIRELEETPRGPYCGALGLWAAGRSTFSLLIRTATKTTEGWAYGVGGGITYESDPEAELQELETKLEALRCRTPSCA